MLVASLIILLFIVVILVKRFLYFRPSSKLYTKIYPFTEIYEGNLHGWFLTGKNDKIILFCHGNAGNISFNQEKAKSLNDLGYSVLLFDYYGYGLSTGIPTEQLCYDSASRFVEYLMHQKIAIKNIILYGESLGAAIAMYTAKKYGISKVIIESGLPSMKKLIEQKLVEYKLGCLKFLGFLFDDFDTGLYMKGYTGKILIIHSPEDELIPIETLSHYSNHLHQNNIFMLKTDGKHCNTNTPWKNIDDFIYERN